MKKLKKNNFLEGAFIAVFCIIVTKVIGILYVIPFYKIIGPQGGTLYGYAYNIYNIFLILSSAGIPLAISKITSEYNTLEMHDKKTRLYQLATKVIVIFSVLSFLICFVFAPQLSDLIIGDLEGGNTIKDVTLVIRSVSFALLVVPILSIQRGYLQGHRYIQGPSLSQVIEQIVRITIIIVGSFLIVKVFKLPIRYGVAVSVFAACLGGLATYLYLNNIIVKNKNTLFIKEKVKSTKKEDKEIIIKILTYAIPFIIISLTNTIYNSADMLFINKTLPHFGFEAIDTEFISSVFTTWGAKFNNIILSIPNGLIISLIPNLVKDYTENNMTSVNSTFNKCIKIILLIITPLAIFMSGTSTMIWNIFYGYNSYGPSIIKYNLLVVIVSSISIVINSLLQSLNKQKLIYISVISGTIAKIILDVPLMYLFNKLNIPAYYGATAATLIGVSIPVIISMIYLNNKMKFSYKETINLLPRFILSMLVLIPMINLFNKILPLESSSRIVQLVNLFISGIFCGGVYLIINFKYIKSLLPEKLLKKLKLVNEK